MLRGSFVDSFSSKFRDQRFFFHQNLFPSSGTSNSGIKLAPPSPNTSKLVHVRENFNSSHHKSKKVISMRALYSFFSSSSSQSSSSQGITICQTTRFLPTLSPFFPSHNSLGPKLYLQSFISVSLLITISRILSHSVQPNGLIQRRRDD